MSAVRSYGSALAGVALLCLLAAIEQRTGVSGLFLLAVSHVIEQQLLPLYAQAIDDPEGGRGAVPLLLVFGGVLIVALVAIVIGYLRVRRRVHRKSMMLVFTNALLAGVFFLLVNNLPKGGGVLLPLAVVLLVVLSWVGWQLFGRSAFFRSFAYAGFWLGIAYLSLSGVTMLVSDPLSLRIGLQHNHSLYGFVWVPFLIIFALDHIAKHPGARQEKPRRVSFWLGIFVLLLVISGVGHVLLGQQALFNNTIVHDIGAAGIVLALVGHLWQHRARLKFALPGQPLPSSGLPLRMILLVVSAIGIGAVAVHSRPTASQRSLEHLVEARPVVAGGPASDPLQHAGATFPASYLAEQSAANGCGSLGGCHVFTTHQWATSAHRYAANPAYQRTVRVLVAEEGVEAARFCARCHDPVHLWSGNIKNGNAYPVSDSEGVTCVVCHSLYPDPKHRGDGHYGLDARPLAAARVRHPFTAYMLVKDHTEQHAQAWTPDGLDSADHCVACHELTVNGVPLRRTVSEWRESPFGPEGSETQSCVDCHMPERRRALIGDFMVHDHSFPGGNIAVSGAAGLLDVTRDFIADALRLEVSASVDEAVNLQVELHNTNVGHDFPTAPKDLVRYWFEYRWVSLDAGTERKTERKTEKKTEWKRLHEGGLFDEALYDRNESPLLQHEIWKTFHAAHRGNPIPPHGSRRFSYPIAVNRRGSSLQVRLMHQRYDSAFIDEPLRTSGLFVGAVEIATAELTP